jgi:hypothetical protein
MKFDHFGADGDAGQAEEEARPKSLRQMQIERKQRWKYEAPLLWMRDHPGHTENDFDMHRGPNATPEQAAEWKRWFNDVWVHQPSSHEW